MRLFFKEKVTGLVDNVCVASDNGICLRASQFASVDNVRELTSFAVKLQYPYLTIDLAEWFLSQTEGNLNRAKVMLLTCLHLRAAEYEAIKLTVKNIRSCVFPMRLTNEQWSRLEHEYDFTEILDNVRGSDFMLTPSELRKCG